MRSFALGGLSAEDMERLERLPPAPERPFRVGSIGRLLGLKGFSMVLRAFARVHREVPESEYWIIGEGPERRSLEDLAAALGCANAVTFFGWLPRSEVLHCLSQIHVLANPSLHESFGYALLEAMAAGRPVISLAVGGPGHLLRGGAGIAIRPRSPGQVTDEIHQELSLLATDASERASLGARARAQARAYWRWDRVADRLIELYAEAVRGVPARAGSTSTGDQGARPGAPADEREG